MRNYTTQMDAAKQGIITPEMKAVAANIYWTFITWLISAGVFSAGLLTVGSIALGFFQQGLSA